MKPAGPEGTAGGRDGAERGRQEAGALQARAVSSGTALRPLHPSVGHCRLAQQSGTAEMCAAPSSRHCTALSRICFPSLVPCAKPTWSSKRSPDTLAPHTSISMAFLTATQHLTLDLPGASRLILPLPRYTQELCVLSRPNSGLISALHTDPFLSFIHC